MSNLAAAQESTREQMKNHKRNGWKWVVRGYYGPKGRKSTPNNPNRNRIGEKAGDLCQEVIHKTDAGKDAEVAAFENRGDIGKIQVIEL